MGRKKVNIFTVPRDGTQGEKISQMCATLDLGGIASSFKRVAEKLQKSHATLFDLLENLLEKEMTWREEKRISRWEQLAHFPFKGTIQEFDFDFPESIDRGQINELLSFRFIESGKNIVFLGPPGVGKTHLAVAFGLEAIYRGHEARFLTLDELIERVEKADQIFSLRLFRTFMRPRLLILDDIDYYDTGKNASAFLFKLVKERHARSLSTIFTSNKDFSGWRDLFGNPEKAGGAIDRIVGRAVIIKIEGESYRIKGKSKK